MCWTGAAPSPSLSSASSARARGAVVGEDPHLDQAMGGEGGVDLAPDRRRRALGADRDDRVEVVRLGALRLRSAGVRIRAGTRLLSGSMTARGKSKKLNKAWLHDHLNDPYVKQAQREGYRARAAYKLKEIDEQLPPAGPGQLVVDLGAAPGAWSQYLSAHPRAVAAAIVALDVLEMEPMEGVEVLQR